MVGNKSEIKGLWGYGCKGYSGKVGVIWSKKVGQS